MFKAQLKCKLTVVGTVNYSNSGTRAFLPKMQIFGTAIKCAIISIYIEMSMASTEIRSLHLKQCQIGISSLVWKRNITLETPQFYKLCFISCCWIYFSHIAKLGGLIIHQSSELFLERWWSFDDLYNWLMRNHHAWIVERQMLNGGKKSTFVLLCTTVGIISTHAVVGCVWICRTWNKPFHTIADGVCWENVKSQ